MGVAPSAAAGRRLLVALKGSPTALVFVHDRPLPALACDLHLALRPLRPVFAAGGGVVGLRVLATVARNRLAPAGQRAELTLLAGRGVQRAAELVEWGLRVGTLGRGAGANSLAQGICWERVCLGRNAQHAVDALERDGALAERLEAEIRAAAGRSVSMAEGG
jgi:hypothetical protein